MSPRGRMAAHCAPQVGAPPSLVVAAGEVTLPAAYATARSR